MQRLTLNVQSPKLAPPRRPPRPNPRVYVAMVQKLHVNTGHATVPQMLRLAYRAKAPQAVVDMIKKFRRPVCEELQVPPSQRVASLKHTETPNDLVGLDVIQVELKRDAPNGIKEIKFDVLTAVDYASDFSKLCCHKDRGRSVAPFMPCGVGPTKLPRRCMLTLIRGGCQASPSNS